MWQGIILCCLIIASVGGNRIKIIGSRQEDSSERLKRDARELVKMCFTNNSNPVVIFEDLLANNWDPSGALDSLIIIDHKFNKQITGFHRTYPTYVLPFDSIENLEPVIDNLQRSKFWNIKSAFVIVGTGLRCLKAGTVLNFMWNRDLLSVYYLCNKKNSTVIFTMNPYASYAPAPWKRVEKFTDNKNKLTLFRLQLTKEPGICKIITFDKTDHLEGAEIRFVTPNSKSNVPRATRKMITNKLLKIQLRLKGINLFQVPAFINATPTLNFIPPLSYIELLKQVYIKELVNNTCEIYAPVVPIEVTDYNHVDVIASYNEQTFSILTKKTNFLTVIRELAEDVQFVVGTMILFVMFTILMFLINIDDLKLAMMDMMRLVVGMGLETPLNRMAMKCVLFFGFLYAFLIVPDFQGHLSALLAEPLRRNVETLEDLHENKFHVYYWDRLESDLMNEQLWVSDADKKYLHPMGVQDMNKCGNKVLEDPKMACIHITDLFLTYTYFSPDLHMSKEPVLKKLLVNWARKNWPLKDKFDEMAIKTSEPGLHSTNVVKRFVDGFLEKRLRLTKRSEESEEYEQFDFDTLIFNYYFVGFCVAFAVIVFVIEIIIARYFRIYRQF